MAVDSEPAPSTVPAITAGNTEDLSKKGKTRENKKVSFFFLSAIFNDCRGHFHRSPTNVPR